MWTDIRHIIHLSSILCTCKIFLVQLKQTLLIWARSCEYTQIIYQNTKWNTTVCIFHGADSMLISLERHGSKAALSPFQVDSCCTQLGELNVPLCNDCIAKASWSPTSYPLLFLYLLCFCHITTIWKVGWSSYTASVHIWYTICGSNDSPTVFT